MSRESQTERHRSLIAFITEYGRASEDASRLRWPDLNIPEAQSASRHKPNPNSKIFGRTFENINEYPSFESQKQAPVKFDQVPVPQSFNLPAIFSVFINEVGASPQPLVAAVDLLVSIVGENKHQPITPLTSDDYQRLTEAQDRLIAVVGEDENHFLTPLINFIGNLIKIHDEESNPPVQTHLPSQETNNPEHTDAVTLKPHRPEKVGRPATLPRLKLADLLSQETDDPASGEVDTGQAVGNEVW